MWKHSWVHSTRETTLKFFTLFLKVRPFLCFATVNGLRKVIAFLHAITHFRSWPSAFTFSRPMLLSKFCSRGTVVLHIPFLPWLLTHSWGHNHAARSCKQFAACKPRPGTAALHLGGQSPERYGTTNPVTPFAPISNTRHEAEEKMQKETGRSELSLIFYQNWATFP